MDIPYDTAISILVIYHRKTCIRLQEDIHSINNVCNSIVYNWNKTGNNLNDHL